MSHETYPGRRESRRRLHRSSGIYNVMPQSPQAHYPEDVLPLETEKNIERFEAVADAVKELESNMTDLAQMHAAVNGGFNEPFAAFLYGLLITMFCNNFPGCPTQAAFESIAKVQRAQTHVEELERRVHLLRDANKKLQDEVSSKILEQKTMAIRNEVLARKTPARRAPLHSASRVPSLRHRKVQVAHDDTFSTTDSFIETPAGPKHATRKPPVPRFSNSTTLGQPPLDSDGPNLNQPPRYMRGLFDKTNTSNVRRTDSKRPRPASTKNSRLASRPPFR